MDSLVAAFHAAVVDHPTHVALVDGQGSATTFADLGARARGYAAGAVRAGLQPGDRALMATPLGPDLYAALAGLWQAGVTAVLPEPAMGLAGLRHAARVTRPKAYVAGGAYRALGWLLPDLIRLPNVRHAQNGPVPEAYHPMALISFTSGSTGAPKAIPRSHAHLLAQFQALRSLLATKDATRDLVAFPVFALINLAEGRTSVLPNWRLTQPHKVTGAALGAWMEAQHVTRALLPPVLAQALAVSGVPASLKHLFSGGGPVYSDVIYRLREEAPDLRVTAVYGSTEAEPIAVLESSDIQTGDWAAMRAGAGLLAGHVVPKISLRLQNSEIQVAGDHVNRAYLDPAQEAETKIADGSTLWHRTGDAGRLDDTGRLWLLGRWRDDHPSGVRWPLEVETAARFWPGVAKAALARTPSGPVLAIVGDGAYREFWVEEASARFDITQIRTVKLLPMDRRHRSKVDHAALVRMLG